MTTSQHPSAPEHLPWFITAPGATDVLYVITTIVVVASVILLGVLFFWLHSLPERMGHKKLQFEIVAVLGLISLFTHHAHLLDHWAACLRSSTYPTSRRHCGGSPNSARRWQASNPMCSSREEPMNSLLYRLGRGPRPCWNSSFVRFLRSCRTTSFGALFRASASAMRSRSFRCGMNCGGASPCA